MRNLRKVLMLTAISVFVLALSVSVTFAQATETSATTAMIAFMDGVNPDFIVYSVVGFGLSIALGSLGLFIRRNVRR